MSGAAARGITRLTQAHFALSSAQLATLMYGGVAAAFECNKNEGSCLLQLDAAVARRRLRLWLRVLVHLGFDGRMLFYHVHAAARHMDPNNPHYGNAVNVIGRYFREKGWHEPSFLANVDAGFVAWLRQILQIDPTGNTALSWAHTNELRDEFPTADEMAAGYSCGQRPRTAICTS
jgi:hypothetical protein